MSSTHSAATSASQATLVEPPRKRLRTAAVPCDDRDHDQEITSLSSPSWKRDEKYYMSGDDCIVIRVGDTLFRVCRLLLVSSVGIVTDEPNRFIGSFWEGIALRLRICLVYPVSEEKKQKA